MILIILRLRQPSHHNASDIDKALRPIDTIPCLYHVPAEVYSLTVPQDGLDVIVLSIAPHYLPILSCLRAE